MCCRDSHAESQSTRRRSDRSQHIQWDDADEYQEYEEDEYEEEYEDEEYEFGGQYGGEYEEEYEEEWSDYTGVCCATGRDSRTGRWEGVVREGRIQGL